MSYAELECKTNFSFLRGASHPKELVARAAELGLKALAINDWDGVYGIPKAYWEKKKHPGLKLITGASLNLEGHARLTLLAKNKSAYGRLCRILSASHAGKEKGKAVLSWDEFTVFFSDAPELFVLAPLESDLKRLKGLVPEKNLFLSLQRVLDGLDGERTEKALWLRKRWQLPLVATNDVHYHIPQRRTLQDAIVAMRELEPVQRIGHKLFPNGERHLKSAEEMRRLFKDLPEAIENTLLISSSCSFCPSELKYQYPSEWIPACHSAQSYMEELVWEGARERYKSGIPEDVAAQLRKEFSLIGQLGFADYFLTIYDIVKFARAKEILCQGRGSAANSAVCYCLGITAVDPVRMQLLFERFLSLERNEPPDIDVDFESERREEVIQYIYEKYGRDRAGMVSAVVTYRGRNSFREICKALGLEVGTLSSKKIEQVFEERAQGVELTDARVKAAALSDAIEGFPRHLSIHSGGFTLSAGPIIEIVPIEPARMEGRTIIQWDKYDLDYLGLLKIDVLSLGMLSAVKRSLKLIGKELHEIPPEDPATYKLIQRADTVGTFQIESRAQISMLGRLQPKNFYDLVVEVAIMRPGPIVGKMVHPYLRRRRGEEPVVYPHPKLKEILGRTLGIPLFQEQVMKMAVELGGFSGGEADELRRSIGTWSKSGNLQSSGKRLMEGLVRSGLSQEYATRIFEQIQGFAQYGFPESHAASFALIAYVSSYLKCHHPLEFLCGLLNAQPMGFYAPHTLIDDAKHHGVKVLPIDPFHAEWDCTLRKGALQLGWKLCKGLHEKEAQAIVAGRPYTGFDDFLRKNSLRREILIQLAMGGTFRFFGLAPREALWSVLQHKKTSSGQGELFRDLEYKSPETSAGFARLDRFDTIREQYKSFSLSTYGHPMQAIREITQVPKLNTRSAKQQPSGRQIRIAGLILVRQRPPSANGMTFSTLEDEFGHLDIAIPPSLWKKERLREVFLANCFLEFCGKLQRDGNSFSLFVSGLKPIFGDPEENQRLGIEPRQYFH